MLFVHQYNSFFQSFVELFELKALSQKNCISEVNTRKLSVRTSRTHPLLQCGLGDSAIQNLRATIFPSREPAEHSVNDDPVSQSLDPEPKITEALRLITVTPFKLDITAIMFSLRSVLGAPSALRQLLPSVSRRSIPGALSLRPFSHMIRNSLTRLRATSSGTGSAAAVTVGATRQIEQVRGMKTRSSVKRLCDGCKV
jgi:large subunit ribosomal protein L36